MSKTAEEWADQYEADSLAYIGGRAAVNPDLAAYFMLAMTQARNEALREAIGRVGDSICRGYCDHFSSGAASHDQACIEARAALHGEEESSDE